MILPLELEKWFIQVFSGDASYFSALALFFLVGLAAYFRMNGIGMFFMIGVFLLMFSGYVPLSLTILIAIISGLVIGYWISQITKR